MLVQIVRTCLFICCILYCINMSILINWARVFPQFGLIQIKLLYLFLLLGSYMPPPLGKYPGVELLGHSIYIFNLLDSGKEVSNVVVLTYPSTSNIWGLQWCHMFEPDPSLLKGPCFLSIEKLWEISLCLSNSLFLPPCTCSTRIQQESLWGKPVLLLGTSSFYSVDLAARILADFILLQSSPQISQDPSPPSHKTTVDDGQLALERLSLIWNSS